MKTTAHPRKPLLDGERYRVWYENDHGRWHTERLTYRGALAEVWKLIHENHGDNLRWFCMFDFGPWGSPHPRPVYFGASDVAHHVDYGAPTKPRRMRKETSC